mmetsp:Transcript_1772/g.3027  ORF Transcript_1772/g.3027 Transcript_1772/m.3027 type:complete len:603 (-) Transcript_1772:1114-2922(-)
MFENTQDELGSQYQVVPPYISRSASAPAIAENVSEAILPEDGSNPSRLNPRIPVASGKGDENGAEIVDTYAELLDESDSGLLSLINDPVLRAPMDLIQADFPSTPSAVYSNRVFDPDAAPEGGSGEDAGTAAVPVTGTTSSGGGSGNNDIVAEDKAAANVAAVVSSTKSDINPSTSTISLTSTGSAGSAGGGGGAAVAVAGGADVATAASLDQTTKALEQLYVSPAGAGAVPTVDVTATTASTATTTVAATGSSAAVTTAGATVLGTGSASTGSTLLGNNPSAILNNGLNPLAPAVVSGGVPGGAAGSGGAASATATVGGVGGVVAVGGGGAGGGGVVVSAATTSPSPGLGMNSGSTGSLSNKASGGVGASILPSTAVASSTTVTGVSPPTTQSSTVGPTNAVVPGGGGAMTAAGAPTGMVTQMVPNMLQPQNMQQQQQQNPQQQQQQPAYYVQQAVYLDQNGQPMFYRPVGNQFGQQEFMYSANGSTGVDSSGLPVSSAAVGTAGSDGSNAQQQQQQQQHASQDHHTHSHEIDSSRAGSFQGTNGNEHGTYSTLKTSSHVSSTSKGQSQPPRHERPLSATGTAPRSGGGGGGGGGGGRSGP